MADRYDPETLLAYIEGDLADDARARFEARLAEDAELRRLVDELSRDRAALRELPQEAPPPTMVDDAIQQLERQMLLGSPSDEPIPIESGKRPPRRHRVFKALAYSGVAAIVLLSGGLILLTLTGTNAIETARRVVQLDRNEESDVAEQSPGDGQASRPPGDVAMNNEALDLDTDSPSYFANRGLRLGSEALESDDVTDALKESQRLTLSPEEPARPDADGVERSLAARLRQRPDFYRDQFGMPDAANAEAEASSSADQPLAEADAPDDVAARGDASELGTLTLRSDAAGTAVNDAGTRAGERANAMVGGSNGVMGAVQAKASAEPARLQVKVGSVNPEQTQAEITNWAMGNQVAVLPAELNDDAAAARAGDGAGGERLARQREAFDDADRMEASDHAEGATESAASALGDARQPMRLGMEPAQLPNLLVHLNRIDGVQQQRAELMVDAEADVEEVSPSPLAWDRLFGQPAVQPPLRQPTMETTAIEVEFVIVPMDDASGDQ